MVKHIEAWDVEPGAVVRSLIRPSARMPTTPWEAFFSALDAGDPKGAWLAASRPLAKYYALPVVGLSLLTKALTGDGLPVSPGSLLSLDCCPDRLVSSPVLESWPGCHCLDQACRWRFNDPCFVDGS